MNSNLSQTQFHNQQLPGLEDVGMKTYPDGELRGTAKNIGDPYKVIYRRLSGVEDIEAIRAQGVGRHWTHSADDVFTPFDNWSGFGEGSESPTTEFVIEAEHPGREHVMTWETDRKEMDATVGPEEYDGAYIPEVPIRGGTPLNIRAIHRLEEWNDPWIREQREETWTA